MIRRRWSTTVRRSIRLRFNAQCTECGFALDERGFDLDHTIPLALGGEDVESNLRPLCRPCHRAKTRGDVTMIAKALRQEAKHTGAYRPRQSIPSRGFRKAPAQRRATTPIVRKFDQRTSS